MSSDNQDIAQRVLGGGYNYSWAAENAGAGQSNWDRAFASWKKSYHHNQNLLDPKWIHLGIAVAFNPDSDNHYYWSMVLASPLEIEPG